MKNKNTFFYLQWSDRFKGWTNNALKNTQEGHTKEV